MVRLRSSSLQNRLETLPTFPRRETFAGIPWNEALYCMRGKIVSYMCLTELKIESDDKAEGVASYVSNMLALIQTSGCLYVYTSKSAVTSYM